MGYKTEVDKRFIEVVDFIKQNKGLSERKILQQAGINNASYFVRIRNGIQSAQLKHIEDICRVFNVSKSYITLGEGEVDDLSLSVDEAIVLVKKLEKKLAIVTEELENVKRLNYELLIENRDLKGTK